MYTVLYEDLTQGNPFVFNYGTGSDATLKMINISLIFKNDLAGAIPITIYLNDYPIMSFYVSYKNPTENFQVPFPTPIPIHSNEGNTLSMDGGQGKIVARGMMYF